MSTLRFYQPYLTPVQLTKREPDEIPQYVSKHMDDWQFCETILPWEQQTCFLQHWQTNDSIRLQYQSNYAPINIKIVNAETGITVYDVNMAQVRQNMDDPEYYIYQADIALNAFAEGYYYLLVTVGIGGILSLISNVMKFSVKVENSLLLEYKHHKFLCDVFFETGFFPSFRIHGTMKPKTPDGLDTVYEDQESNLEMLKTVPFQPWTFSIGGSEGIPPWVIRRINHMIRCSTLKIDGRYYTKPEGAKFDENAVEFYPMAGFSIELREKLNRSSVIYENENVEAGTIAVVANVDSKGFGGDQGGSVFQVTDIQ